MPRELLDDFDDLVAIGDWRNLMTFLVVLFIMVMGFVYGIVYCVPCFGGICSDAYGTQLRVIHGDDEH